MPKIATLWRLRIGEEPEAMNLSGHEGIDDLKTGVCAFVVDTTEPNVFYAGFHNFGLAKLIIEPDSADVQVEILGCDPTKDPAIGGGEHAKGE
jgi:hypothetical protein